MDEKVLEFNKENLQAKMVKVLRGTHPKGRTWRLPLGVGSVKLLDQDFRL